MSKRQIPFRNPWPFLGLLLVLSCPPALAGSPRAQTQCLWPAPRVEAGLGWLEILLELPSECEGDNCPNGQGPNGRSICGEETTRRSSLDSIRRLLRDPIRVFIDEESGYDPAQRSGAGPRRAPGR